MAQTTREPSSFRDPSGFVFRSADGTLLRQVNRVYEPDFQQLIDSGLYRWLVQRRWLVEHEERGLEFAYSDEASRVLAPREVPLVSYPYEWCFSALQDAALLTLDIQSAALDHGMSLKDASAFNVQFEGVQPIFVDTLSFETYRRDKPWKAYGQFCRHFLAPLALMARGDIRHGRLSALYLDGIPLALASRMLPWRTRLSPSLLMHLHLHARMAERGQPIHAARAAKATKAKVSLAGLRSIIASLRSAIAGLRWSKPSAWSGYYEDNAYSPAALAAKQQIVRHWLAEIRPQTVWDLGANTGMFSRIAAQLGCRTAAMDVDPACVEINFQQAKRDGIAGLLPLVIDLANPSPAIGWAGGERQALAQRGPADAAMALALVHHLAITHNLPLGHIAEYFHQLGRHLIIEFVPREDPQTQRLLLAREDIFEHYNQSGFESAFSAFYSIRDRQRVAQTGRWLYRLEAKACP